jgi:CelD/BcsL family acetyltransferase involved in cellulose biosynthesis
VPTESCGAAMPNAITCTVYRHLKDLQNLVKPWRMLWAEDSQATPFQSPEWLLPWARQFARSDLRIRSAPSTSI